MFEHRSMHKNEMTLYSTFEYTFLLQYCTVFFHTTYFYTYVSKYVVWKNTLQYCNKFRYKFLNFEADPSQYSTPSNA